MKSFEPLRVVAYLRSGRASVFSLISRGKTLIRDGINGYVGQKTVIAGINAGYPSICTLLEFCLVPFTYKWRCRWLPFEVLLTTPGPESRN